MANRNLTASENARELGKTALGGTILLAWMGWMLLSTVVPIVGLVVVARWVIHLFH